ncbi:MAG: serine--tRNA ligase [Candidatus Ryanbacteria bacterium RIFCSPHIGHO2_02_FULL_48_12]|uniref:Serine--tRNA ligase n=1 Tax=Candidatus Ryanbacteria bacterium RIFCSPHIGHO2_01_FULL_48_27 TaxID=1802115 RepID=A0A1G2G7F7_9BACT|nr:MAG: serine--tRNA ligase [Candidatus Ryanbacteria bacterium RIFCSPHIGHO2_01_FULL_48_27]OGZ49395.1 MAG: serine--tRNA ligase [Candidatus Ryanbacteria bacterium RIFCSPHIGHO2_02_FULL_48_12]
MLDIKFIRENPDIIKDALRKKHLEFDVQNLIDTDEKRRVLIKEVDDLRAEQHTASDAIAKLAGPERDEAIKKVKNLKERLGSREEKLRTIEALYENLMLLVPNVPDLSVPEGESDADNQEVRAWGDIPKFDFTPKSHIELMEMHDMVDFERGAKTAGFRGYYLKNDGALLSFAVWQLVLNMMVKKGYVPMIVPSLIKKEVFVGTGYLPQGEEDLYRTQDDLYLSGTGEVGAMGYYMGEILEEKNFPIKMLVFSPCFRREAGSHGKDTKGLMRVHEFYKWEQVILSKADHLESVRLHEELVTNAEEIMQALEIPYHVVANCGGDLGLGQVKKYDIEAWLPSEDRYRETHSASYFHDFQTRRLNIRYRDEEGKLRFAHSLNSTALPMPPRPLISLIENHQEADGSIRIPKALQPYMGKEKIEKGSK